jgi:hypothetical protein
VTFSKGSNGRKSDAQNKKLFSLEEAAGFAEKKER